MNKNRYGFISGGSLFDIADRFAHDWLCENRKDQLYWFTSKAEVKFLKQCCNEKVSCRISLMQGFPQEYRMIVEVYDENSILAFEGEFWFVAKDHNFCDLNQGENSGK